MVTDYSPLFERFLPEPSKKVGDAGWHGAFCPFHEIGGKSAGHKSPSFGFNQDSGGWKCLGCHKAGNAIDFAGMMKVGSYDPGNRDHKNEAMKVVNSILPDFEIRSSNRRRTVNASGELPKSEEITEATVRLQSDFDALEYLEKKRGWSTETIRKHRIGISDDRKHFLIPIEVEGELVNVRYYSPKGVDPWHPDAMKIRGVKGRNEVRIFPDSVLGESSDKLFVVEGESDALAALSIGLSAVTFTGGAGNCPSDLHRLQGKEITILYDNDEAGSKGAKKVAQSLRKFTQQIKILDFDSVFKGGTDLTDAVVEHGGESTAKLLIAAEKAQDFQPSNSVRHTHAREVDFAEAINSTNIGAKIKLKAMVMGTRERPYAAYSRVAADCASSGSKPICTLCPLSQGHGAYPNGENDRLTEKELLKQIRKPDGSLQKELKKVCGFLCDEFEVNEVRSTIESIYELVVGPYHEENSNDESVGFQQRTVFACNNGKQYRINQPYQFEGVTIPQPWDQANTHVFTRHEDIERTVDGFELSEEGKKRLRIFQV